MGNTPVEFHAFTTRCNGIAGSLRNTAGIESNGNRIEVTALWDTGATNSCISHDVVQKLSLTPTGKITIQTPSGASVMDTFMVNVLLPNRVIIPDVVVCDSDIGAQGIGMLIGMDIIRLGDFAVSNYDGKTVFTFRLPSKQTTDYVQQINLANIMGPPHGPGKRKRKR